MLPVKVQKISFHPPSRSYAVILCEINGSRKLPVIVGAFEAQSIALALDTIWRHRSEAWKTINYKGQLIEYCHANAINNPKFNLVNVSGPDHQKMFEVHVTINGDGYPTGVGTDKKSAEQSAAQKALDSLMV